MAFAPCARFCANSWSAAMNATVFALSVLPARKKLSDQLAASFQGALLNHMSWCTVWLTWNEKLPISSLPRCFTSGISGAVGTVA